MSKLVQSLDTDGVFPRGRLLSAQRSKNHSQAKSKQSIEKVIKIRKANRDNSQKELQDKQQLKIKTLLLNATSSRADV